ncbi:Fms-interacting protein-domain-containing protein [Powellomyces hirtus]|nr:Fms-interacting protein-domain-containing protein [Powellomyces hirtus]
MTTAAMEHKRTEVENRAVKADSGKQPLAHVDAVGPVCEDLRNEIHVSKKLKTEHGKGTPSVATGASKMSKQASLRFMDLLQLQRACCTHTLTRKQTTQEAKMSMDRLYLDLQNVLYEIRHYESKIAECEELETQYQKVNLISESELNATSQDAAHVLDPHLIMLKRLNFELMERKRLVDEQKALEKELERVEAERLKELQELENMDKELSTALKATEPLQKRLNMTNTASRGKSETSALLPEPLFVLYKHAVGFAKTYENDISIDISGDFQLAAMMKSDSSSSNVEEASDKPLAGLKKSRSMDDMDVDQEQQGQDSSKVHTDRSATYYSRHPLNVVLTIQAAGGSEEKMATLTFSYLTNLQIVVVAPDFTSPLSNIPSKLLTTGLFPSDIGQESPNPANTFLGSETDPFRFDANTANGYAFVWAQTLCGLDYPSPMGTLRYYMSKLPGMIRNRIEALRDLKTQLAQATGSGNLSWNLVDANHPSGLLYEVTSKGNTDEVFQLEVILPPASSTTKAQVTTKENPSS